MKKVEYRLNDYVINESNKVCKVVGTRFKQHVNMPTQMVTLEWHEDKDGKVVTHIEEVEATEVIRWSFNMIILTAIGFKKGESLHTVVYRDSASKRSIVIDRTDGSVYAFLCSRHIMMDFVYVDAVHEIQHAFDAADIEFPCLDGWLFSLNKMRKPPIKLSEI